MADDSYRVVGEYVGRILKGEKAGDLPIQQPSKTPETLGIEVPPMLPATADVVIE